MMYALAVLLLIAINVHGQKEVCTLAPELVDVYQGFHDRWFKRPGRTYVTVTFKPDMYPLAKEVLNEPGRYATDNEVYKVTKGWMILTEDSSTIEKKVEKVLRSKFIFQLVKAVFLLIAVNVQGQEKQCTLAPTLVEVYQRFHDEWFKRRSRYVTVAVFLLIAVNVQGQEKQCTLAPGLVEVYQRFHDEWFKRRSRYVTVTFKDEVYPLAKEELNEPGKYSKYGDMYSTTTGSMELEKDGMSIAQKVDKVLRSKFLRQLVKLKFRHPRKFACAEKFTSAEDNKETLTITCLYTRNKETLPTALSSIQNM
ncbi:unnamed protein product [Nippostrongylus brasiliensis]|uniref:Salivary lipocalin n=1 Tax=Nippostrongylus brasiliensis TaxID=27835 RepID=A0A0N4YHS4_NIPBR|nr:unnamed protein product [Nippostrongylus brasiliensis]